MSLIEFDTTKTIEEKSFYVIILVMNGERRASEKLERYDYHVFFESDHYSVYSGNLQTTYYITDARQWKTQDGALKTIKRLTERGIIKERHKARAARYTRITTEYFATVTEPTAPEGEL